MHAKPTSYLVALALLTTGLIAIAPASADTSTELPEPTTPNNAIPPCATTHPEATVGPVTVGVDYFCSPYVEVDDDWPQEDPTERCEVNLDPDDDRPPYVACQLTASDNQQCFYIYWYYQVGPVYWEQTSSCEGEIGVDDEWEPPTPDCDIDTDDEVPVSCTVPEDDQSSCISPPKHDHVHVCLPPR